MDFSISDVTVDAQYKDIYIIEKLKKRQYLCKCVKCNKIFKATKLQLLKLGNGCLYCTWQIKKNGSKIFNIGDHIFDIVIIDKSQSPNDNFVYTVQCKKCGLTSKVGYRTIVNIEHGCIKCRVKSYRQSNIINYNYDESSLLPQAIFSRLVRSALQRGINIEVTKTELYDLLVLQNYKCKLSGIPLTLSVNTKLNTASVDRIDSTKGYVIDNIQWVHKVLNKMKLNLQDNDFIDWCTKICDYQRSQSE